MLTSFMTYVTILQRNEKINFCTKWSPISYPATIIRYLFKIHSYFFQLLFEVGADFPSVSNQFSHSFHRLCTEVDEFCNSLKSAHALQQLTCGRMRDSASLSTPIRIALCYTLCVGSFLFCSSDFVLHSTVRRTSL